MITTKKVVVVAVVLVAALSGWLLFDATTEMEAPTEDEMSQATARAPGEGSEVRAEDGGSAQDLMGAASLPEAGDVVAEALAADERVEQPPVQEAKASSEEETVFTISGQVVDGVGEPAAEVSVVARMDGSRQRQPEATGTSDADGWLECPIPGNARRAELVLNPGTDQEQEFTIVLGRVSPVTELCGVCQRLQNLGFDCGGTDQDELTPALKDALRAFQRQNQLEETGEPDEATCLALLEIHGS